VLVDIYDLKNEWTFIMTKGKLEMNEIRKLKMKRRVTANEYQELSLDSN
jgi:hypothetical protein